MKTVFTKNMFKSILVSVLLVGNIFAQLEFSQPKVITTAKALETTREFDAGNTIKNMTACPVPKSNYISFETQNGKQNKIWVMNTLTNEIKSVSPRIEGDGLFAESESDLNWIPTKINNKVWFYFVSSEGGDDNILLGNVEDRFYLKLTNAKSNDNSPKSNFDGSKMVYASSKSGGGDLYLVNNIIYIIDNYNEYCKKIKKDEFVLDITNKVTEKRITRNKRAEFQPDWSYNGKSISYIMKGKKSYDIYLLDIENLSSKAYRVTANDSYDEIFPKFSTSGNSAKIAYYSTKGFDKLENRSKSLSINVIDANTGSNIKLNNNTVESFIDKSLSNFSESTINKSLFSRPVWGLNSQYLFYIKADKNTSSHAIVYAKLNSSQDKNKKLVSEYSLIPANEEKSYNEIVAVNNLNYTKLYILSWFKGDYVIEEMLLFDPNMKLDNRVTNSNTKHNFEVGFGLSRSYYLGDADGSDFEIGQDFYVGYYLYPFKNNNMNLNFRLIYSLDYLINYDAGRRPITTFALSTVFNYKINMLGVRPDLYAGFAIGSMSFGAGENAESSTSFALNFGAGLTLAERFRITPLISYVMMNSNIDNSPEFQDDDSYIKFNLGISYLFDFREIYAY
jgi:hypothetical protein